MKITPHKWHWNKTALEPALWTKSCPDQPVLWQAWLTDDPSAQARLLSILSPEEHGRLARFQQPEDRRRFLTGRGLLRMFVGNYFKISPERVQFHYGPFGKPFVISRAGADALHFNVAHSGKLVLLAFHPLHEVGVDVEEIRPDIGLEKIARQMFAADELQRWLQLKTTEQLPAFYQTWTRHEAALKAAGLGITGERHAAVEKRSSGFDLALPPGYLGAAAFSQSL